MSRERSNPMESMSRISVDPLRNQTTIINPMLPPAVPDQRTRHIATTPVKLSKKQIRQRQRVLEKAEFNRISGEAEDEPGDPI